MAIKRVRLAQLIAERYESTASFARAVGVTPGAVSNWMAGRTPGADNAIRCAELLGVTVEELFERRR